MRRISFLRGLLLLPLVFPLLIAPFAKLGELAAAGLVLSSIALLFGGIPYLVFCVCSLYLLRRAGADRFRKFLMVAPVWFLIPMNLGVLVAELASRADDLELRTFWVFSRYALGFGYAYVALGFAGDWLGGRLGWFTEEPTSST